LERLSLSHRGCVIGSELPSPERGRIGPVWSDPVGHHHPAKLCGRIWASPWPRSRIAGDLCRAPDPCTCLSEFRGHHDFSTRPLSSHASAGRGCRSAKGHPGIGAGYRIHCGRGYHRYAGSGVKSHDRSQYLACHRSWNCSRSRAVRDRRNRDFIRHHPGDGLSIG
jgi:hypothetical protein